MPEVLLGVSGPGVLRGGLTGTFSLSEVNMVAEGAMSAAPVSRRLMTTVLAGSVPLSDFLIDEKTGEVAVSLRLTPPIAAILKQIEGNPQLRVHVSRAGENHCSRQRLARP